MIIAQVILKKNERAFRIIKDNGNFIDIDLPNDVSWKQFLGFYESMEITEKELSK